MLEGIDVSSYQGVIDWHRVAQSGKKFAFCKATEGLGYSDPRFAENWAGMRHFGLVRGAYHFLHPSISGTTQADFFHTFVHDHGGTTPLDFTALDVEELDGMAEKAVVSCMEQFIGRVRERMHRQVVVYTNPNVWRNLLGDPASPAISHCPLWLADWSGSVPTLGTWPHGLSFLQYSDSGHCPGVEGPVDLDRFYGSPAQLSRLARLPHA